MHPVHLSVVTQLQTVKCIAALVSETHRRVAHMLKVVHKGAVAIVRSVLESVLRSVCAPRLLCKEATSILWGSLVLLGMCRFSGNCGCF